MRTLKLVNEILTDLALVADVSKEWGAFPSGGGIAFEDLSTENKIEWVRSMVGVAEARNLTELSEDREEIIKQHLGGLTDENYDEAAPKSQKVVTGLLEATADIEGSGSSSNKTGSEIATKVGARRKSRI